MVRGYLKFWRTVRVLAKITDDIARDSLVLAMSALNEILSAFIAKLLVFLAPLPSAVNLGIVLVTRHEYAAWQGVIFAVVLELSGYGITERAIFWLFDGKTKPAKKAMAGTLWGAYYALLFVVVWILIPSGVELIFPILSAILALFYALVRHDEIMETQRKVAATRRKPQRNTAPDIAPKAAANSVEPDAILAVLESGPLGTGALADAIGVSPNTAKARIDPLFDAGAVVKSGRKWALHKNGSQS